MKKKILVPIVALLLFGSAAPLHAEPGSFRITAVPAEEEAAPENDVLSEEKTYSAGSYTVGEDIPEGEYVLFGSSEEAGIRIGSTKDSSYQVSSDTFSYNLMVVLTEGQNVTLTDCSAVPVNSVDKEELKLDGPGMFKVGMHFPNGTYTVVPDPGVLSVLTVYSTIAPETVYREITVTAAQQVYLSAGQYVRLEGCRFDPAPSPAVTVYKDKDTVMRVQAQLNAIGYSCGTPDGMIGSKTTEAVKKFQKDHALTEDGRITDHFRKALDTESPLSGIEAEFGPFVSDTATFVSRYNDAAKAAGEGFAAITEQAAVSGEWTPHGNGSIALQVNHAGDKIKSGFYLLSSPSFDKQSVQELAQFLYAVDKGCKDYSSAEQNALRLLFDSSLSSSGIRFSVLSMDSRIAVWARSES